MIHEGLAIGFRIGDEAMAIRFACANCGKHHRISDQHAGRAGRCGRCGHRFIAPGPPSSVQASAFVPAARPNLYAPQKQSRWGTTQAIAGGLILALTLVWAMFSFRDRIVAAVPGLAAMLPAQAAPLPAQPAIAPAAVPDQGNGPFSRLETGDLEWVALGIGYLVGGIVLPIIAPPILSRRGYLSVGRWVIFAGLSMLLIVPVQARLGSLGSFAYMPQFRAEVNLLHAVTTTLFLSVCGCLIAAGIHPKASA